jgi:quercetin dioxygenase-like cupin family protein
MAQPVMKLFHSDGQFHYWLYSFAKKGDELQSHVHAFEHTAIIPTGSSFECYSPDRRVVVDGPHIVTFRAGVWHGMIARHDGAECYAPMPVQKPAPTEPA